MSDDVCEYKWHETSRGWINNVNAYAKEWTRELRA